MLLGALRFKELLKKHFDGQYHSKNSIYMLLS